MSQKNDDNKEGGFYVVEGLNYFSTFLAVDISSESEPEELDDLEDLEDIKVDDQELNDLDKLIATTKSIISV